VFTVRYGLGLYVKQIGFVFRRKMFCNNLVPSCGSVNIVIMFFLVGSNTYSFKQCQFNVFLLTARMVQQKNGMCLQTINLLNFKTCSERHCEWFSRVNLKIYRS
jgi:hypothetical protein